MRKYALAGVAPASESLPDLYFVRYVAHMSTHAARGGAAAVAPRFTIADRLRKARESAGLEQGQLAADIDVSRSTIGNYESARVTPRRIVLRAWALRTGVPLEWLERGEGETHEPWPGGSVAAPTEDECAARDSNPEPAD